MELTMDKRFINVLMLGLAYMLVFTSFQTQGNMQQAVIDSIQKEDPTFTGSGYISLAVIYIVFAASNWFAPSVLSFIGPKLTMIVGGITYTVFIASFLWPQTWLLYAMSVMVGIGAALIWTGQGNYLTLMSDDETMTRNSGIFWAMLQSSLVIGNVFVLTQFQGQETIDKQTRTLVFGVLTGVSVAGLIIMVFLPKPGAGSGREDTVSSPTKELVKSFKLFKTKDMLMLSVAFFYTGLELSFFSGVYSACLSFTLRFEDPKALVGLSGILIGCGEILGGAVFGIFSKKTNRFGRDPIVLLGFLIHMVTFFLIFLNIPSNAPLGDTHDPNYLTGGQPSEVIALMCSFFLGLGDACFNTQIYSILGSVYADNSGPAFALFKFTQSLSAAACFFYSGSVPLQFQLLILVIFGCMGTISFCMVEWKVHRKLLKAHDSESEGSED